VTASLNSPLRASSAHTAGNPTNPYEQAKAQGLTVKNIGNQAQTYSASNQKLVAAGKQYSASFQAEAFIPNSSTVQVNPGLEIEPSVAFDVPVGTVPDGMDLHDSGLSGGVMVNLQGAPIPAS